jgi:N utilization substance protein B
MPEPLPLERLLSFDWEAEKPEEDAAVIFARALTAGTIENLDVIDEKIKENLINWSFSRLKRVDLAILRISAYSLLFQKDIPDSVVIEEAIGICKDYGEEGSFKFVNAMLDSIKKRRGPPASPQTLGVEV